MTNRAFPARVPFNSRIATLCEGASFVDAWSIEVEAADGPALRYFIQAARNTPRWIDTCMALRNNVVALFGLKDLGYLSAVPENKAAREYKPGDRVGIFNVIENAHNESLLGDEDKHLRVVLSVHRLQQDGVNSGLITVTTVVHVKNWLGRLYMLPVTPMHRLIMPSVLQALAR